MTKNKIIFSLDNGELLLIEKLGDELQLSKQKIMTSLFVRGLKNVKSQNKKIERLRITIIENNEDEIIKSIIKNERKPQTALKSLWSDIFTLITQYDYTSSHKKTKSLVNDMCKLFPNNELYKENLNKIKYTVDYYWDNIVELHDKIRVLDMSSSKRLTAFQFNSNNLVTKLINNRDIGLDTSEQPTIDIID